MSYTTTLKEDHQMNSSYLSSQVSTLQITLVPLFVDYGGGIN